MSNPIFFQKPDKWYKIWSFILMEVSYKEGKLPIGSGFFRYKDIASKCRGTEDIVEKCVAWLKREGMIATQKATHWILIRVTNWSEYQWWEDEDFDWKSDTESDTESGTGTEHERDKSGTKATIYIKKVRKKNKERIQKEFFIYQQWNDFQDPFWYIYSNFIIERREVLDECFKMSVWIENNEPRYNWKSFVTNWIIKSYKRREKPLEMKLQEEPSLPPPPPAPEKSEEFHITDLLREEEEVAE